MSPTADAYGVTRDNAQILAVTLIVAAARPTPKPVQYETQAAATRLELLQFRDKN